MKRFNLLSMLAMLTAFFAIDASVAISEETKPASTDIPLPVGQKTEKIERLNLLPGFVAEKIYDVPKEQEGSWVAICRGPGGSLFVSDQGGAGIFQVFPAAIGDNDGLTTTAKINVPVSSAQGLCFHNGTLYANVNGKGSGVWAITDSDSDGKLDAAKHILPLRGAGEHGPHAIFPTPNEEKLIVMGGNYTRPAALSSSRIPSNWKEDLLLPRQGDSHGHANGLLAPGGWIAQMNPDGSEFEMLSMGYRNPYDSAFSPEGELFAYDADMEWDMGAPWYRPTRICHATSGSEFGWRAGTGKWPTYFEDSLPPVVDIGPGSPVGVLFGTGGKFPERYQRALYALDWTFGTIHAIHLKPNGASYTGTEEEFISGTPLPVTDAVIGEDGAFYFTTGGRGIQSSLYRVSYQGNEATAEATKQSINHANLKRRQLEKYHGKTDPKAVEAAWPSLSSSDRFIRYAARIAIENQPVEQWADRALTEEQPERALIALMALCRQGDASQQQHVLDALLKIDYRELSDPQKLILLRDIGLCFMRLGPPSEKQREAVIDLLDDNFPGNNDQVNVELARLLIYLDAPGVIAKVLALMETASPPQVPEWGELIGRNKEYGSPIAKMLENYPPLLEIQYAFMLRNLRYGWTLEERRRYFQWFLDAAKHPGGHSFSGFLTNIRKVALENCSPGERKAVADLTGQKVEGDEIAMEVTPPTGPGREWTLEAAVRSLDDGLVGRDFHAGRNLFYAAQCGACHRFDGNGGYIGPDLTSVSSRLSHRDLLENIIHPSRVISDQYGSHLVSTADGREIVGRVVPGGKDDPADSIRLHTQNIEAEPVLLLKEDIEEMTPSPISQMPVGLLNNLSEAELLDLIAFLLSRGNPDDRMFTQEKQLDKASDLKDASTLDNAVNGQPRAAGRGVRDFKFTYGTRIGPFPTGSNVRVWFPIASDTEGQHVKIDSIHAPDGFSIEQESRYGNQMLYFEGKIGSDLGDANGGIDAEIVYDVRRFELAGLSRKPVAEKIDSELQSVFLQPNKMVPIAGPPATLSASWALPAETLGRARSIYDGILGHMTYDKRPGYGRGDVRWACRSGYGNCTDFHSLFISIARHHGIPARFEIGFPIPGDRSSGEIKGYHCWASFFEPQTGWVSVDISEGKKNPELSDYFFGNLNEDRVGFTVGRDLQLVPRQNGDPLNYFIYPYVEVDGKPCDSKLLSTRLQFADRSSK